MGAELAFDLEKRVFLVLGDYRQGSETLVEPGCCWIRVFSDEGDVLHCEIRQWMTLRLVGSRSCQTGCDVVSSSSLSHHAE